jgi:hypothetical protein
MDIKIETTGGWPLHNEGRARKTTRGEGYTSIVGTARVIVTGPDAWKFANASSICTRLDSGRSQEYLPNEMKQWLGLGSEASITSGGFTSSSQGGQYIIDFGFRLTKRGRGHANFGKQFRSILAALDSDGTLQEIAKRIVLDEVARAERAASDEAQQLRLASVAAFVVSSVKEQAEILLDYRIKLDALRKTRLDKMDELCTAELLEQMATQHSLSLEELSAEVATRMVHRPLAFSLGD